MSGSMFWKNWQPSLTCVIDNWQNSGKFRKKVRKTYISSRVSLKWRPNLDSAFYKTPITVLILRTSFSFGVVKPFFIEGTITAAKYLALSWNHDSYCPEASNVFLGELFKTPKRPCPGSDKQPISSSTPLTSSSQKIRKKISNEGKPQ